jgi:structural maintenance of chromosome 4
MSKLSGGEKTLASLSLIFALHIFKPSPLYCMDEIDAALDYKNVAVVGKYIKEGVCKQGSAAIAQAAGGARARAS